MTVPLADCLLSEPEVTHGPWRYSSNVELALEELEDLAHRDPEQAYLKVEQLYRMVTAGFQAHFGRQFEPGCASHPRALRAAHLPRLCHLLHSFRQRLYARRQY